MTMRVEEDEGITRVARASGRICAVNDGYSAYPMVRQARAMMRAGEIGKIRLVVANFSHGHHGDADNPRVHWRHDPAMAGVSGQFADCGIHALHMASFICGDQVAELSADMASTIASRVLEGDAMVNFRTERGTAGRLWTLSVATGRERSVPRSTIRHGKRRVSGDRSGGFRTASTSSTEDAMICVMGW